VFLITTAVTHLLHTSSFRFFHSGWTDSHICLAFGIISTILIVEAPVTLALLALDCLMIVKAPIQARVNSKCVRARSITTCLTWTFSGIIGFLFILLGKPKNDACLPYPVCPKRNFMSNIFMGLLYNLINPFCIFVTIVFYGLLFNQISKFRRAKIQLSSMNISYKTLYVRIFSLVLLSLFSVICDSVIAILSVTHSTGTLPLASAFSIGIPAALNPVIFTIATDKGLGKVFGHKRLHSVTKKTKMSQHRLVSRRRSGRLVSSLSSKNNKAAGALQAELIVR